jgi:hypothetical protein
MTPFLRKLLGQNWVLLLSMLALAVFGVIAIYSATSTRADSYASDFWRKQANWVIVGVFAFMLTSLIHYRWIRWGALPMYLAGIVFLILTKFGHKGVRSAQLVAFWSDQLSASAACGSGRHHGPSPVSDTISRNASDAAIALLRGNCSRAMFAHSDATRPG